MIKIIQYSKVTNSWLSHNAKYTTNVIQTNTLLWTGELTVNTLFLACTTPPTSEKPDRAGPLPLRAGPPALDFHATLSPRPEYGIAAPRRAATHGPRLARGRRLWGFVQLSPSPPPTHTHHIHPLERQKWPS